MRQYLLGRLAEADTEKVELRLLTDSDYANELDIIERELIDQYVEETLSTEERTQFEQFFLKAPERRDKLAFAEALSRAARAHAPARHRAKGSGAIEKLRPRWHSFSPVYLKAAAIIIVVLCVGLVGWLLIARRPEAGRGQVAFREAYKKQRLVEARITGLNYTPLVIARGPEDPNINQTALRQAELQLLNDLSAHPDAETHHALGRFYLAGTQLDKAIEHFEAAVKQEPSDARIYSDLGAALLEKGKNLSSEPEVKGIKEFARSLEHLNKALELNPSLLEARFNRALLYRRMSLLSQAESDWRSYLEKDSSSGWAEEARQNLREIEEQRNKTPLDEGQVLRTFYSTYENKDDDGAWELLSRNYTSSGNKITNTLIDSLGSEATGRELQALEYVGQLESREAGDSYTAELARSYRSSGAARRRTLLQARAQLKKGYEQYLLSNLNEALKYYASAQLVFDGAGSQCESIFTQYLIGLCHVLRFDLAQAGPIFERLLATCRSRGYMWLFGQSLYRMAMLRLHDNKYSEALEHSHQALETLERIQDVNGTIKLLILLADEYQSLNDEQRSLGLLQRALSLTGESNMEPQQVWGIYTAMGLNFSSLKLYAAALEYQKEAIRLASGMMRPLLISRSHAYLGMTYGNLKFYDEALAHIEQAAKAGSSLSSELSGQEIIANTSLYAGEIYRWQGQHDRAVESYDRAINFYAGLDFPYFRYAAHKGKLLALLARNDDASVDQELQKVLALFEQYRINLTGESHRNTFFDVEQSVYDQAMDFAFTRKRDIGLAFDYSELSRARSLLDAMRQGAQAAGDDLRPELRLRSASAPLRASDIQQKMPEPAQILQYAVLPDRILIWVIARSGVSAKEVKVGARELEEKVRAYLRAVKESPAGETAQFDQTARDLYEILIKPTEPHLDKTKLLCVVPDKILHHLPYGALVSASTGRYLVEDFRLGTAPSSSIFVESSEEAARKAAVSQETLLSVGDPNFDRDEFTSLPPLLSARVEAKAITPYYKSSNLLLGDAAREAAVKSELVKANVANFALHYIVDEQSNIRSGMVLAGGRRGSKQGGEDGVWRVYEIYKMKLPRTRLVVLSACQTGVEQQYRGEGAVSVARPFIAAGVPVVVASLWAVDSGSTARLMVSFHRHRARDRLPTAEALRRAQLELLGGADARYRQPYYWAAFAPIGGYTEF